MLKLIHLSILVLVINHSYAQFVSTETLPYESMEYKDILFQKDDAIQLKLEKLIKQNKTWSKLIKKKKMAIGLVDLRRSDDIKYASINGQHMMYAASLPKIAVLLAAMESIKDGCLVYSPKIKSDLRLMIAKSNNAATTRMIETIGFDKIAATMEDPKYMLYDFHSGGGLWVGKKYAKSGKKNPDPLKGLSHAASVDQVCRFYTMLAYGKLVNEKYNEEMMKYLIDPQINHKFVKTLNKIAPEVDIYRKSGSWKSYHSDSALVFGEGGRKYILVALIDDINGSRICSNLVKTAEKALGLENEVPDNILKSRRKTILRKKIK